MSIGSVLSIARTALSAHQLATEVASHNIANAQTEGYSAQRALLVPGRPYRTVFGSLGSGVRVDDITRRREALLDRTFRSQTSTATSFGLRRDLTSQVEGLLLEPTDRGLSSALDAFWNSWSDLANNPTEPSARTVVRERGRQVAANLNRLASGLGDLRQSTAMRVTAEADELNRLASGIADLNRQIVSAEAAGQTASDLRDSRDRLVDRMASIASIETIDRTRGDMAVLLGGIAIVDGAATLRLSAVSTSGVWSLRTESNRTFSDPGGSIGAGMQFLNADLPALGTRLDEIARSLAKAVNDLHKQGTSPAGTGIRFFHVATDPADPSLEDYSSVTATSITLSAEVVASTNAIAAGRGDANTPPGYRAGATDIALEIATLRDTGLTDLGGASIARSYSDIVTSLGLTVQSAAADAEVHETLAAQSATRRESVSGVSTDEELIMLMRSQSAYAAAAKLVTTADEMLQSLLEMV